MSIKDLFNNYKHNQFTKSETVASSSVLLESVEYIEAKQQEFDKFIPDIDFSSASNFAKFGSAEMYYETAFKRIYQEYPYDGTLAEKQEFENESSYLDRYVFNYIYPRTNGYVVFSNQGTAKADANPAGGNYTNPTVKEYILIHGGPHTASSGMIGSTIHSKFEKSGIYDISSRRGSSLEMTMASGSTVEFWLKKPSAMTLQREEIFDLHNGEASGSMYGRLKLYLTSSDQSLYMTLISGSDGFQNVRLMTGTFDGNWNHHAISLITSSAGTHVKVYKNNKLINSFVSGGVSDIAPVNQGLIATIGASSRDDFAGNGDIGYNKLSASLDEFRFWKKERSHKEIDNNWFIPAGGGTNEYDSNIDLGVYYKFNEGTTTNSTYDAKVLDYSGRMCDGSWVGYATGARSSGSAMVESGATLREFRDPIIRSSHPEVSSSKTQYMLSGSLADIENPSMFYRLFPSWMQEEDTKYSGQLKTLSHLIGSYFDTIWHQTNEISKLKNHRYVSGSNKAYPFARNVLYSRGFAFPELFTDASSVELFLNKDNNEVYEKNIKEVKDTLYHNVNLGLISMYKSKGTSKAFRNYFRTLGINSNLVIFNKYADNSTHLLKNNYYNDTTEKRYINFYSDLNNSATIFTTSGSANSNTYVAAAQNYSSITLETDIILPRKNRISSESFLETNFISSSVAGFHTADSNIVEWAPTASDCEMKLYIIKEVKDNQILDGEYPRVKFALVSSQLPFELTSSYISEQYADNRWKLAVKVKHEKYPYSSLISGSTTANYDVEFYGVESEGRTKRNSFSLTCSVSSHGLINTNKRFYAGAHRQNFTGSVLQETDVKLGNLVFWNSYLSNNIIDEHSYDISSYGIDNPEEEDVIGLNSVVIPRSETLVFNWNFDTITGSDATGSMRVYDFSSGSSTTRFGSVSDTIDRMHEGYGQFFANSNTKCVDKNYIYSTKRRNPNNLYTDDNVSIVSQQEEFFFQDNDTNDVVYSFEKSLYGVVSAEMMKMFATTVDFNTLIGQPNFAYHSDYNKLLLLKERFFDHVEEDLDFEKFVSFYKWIDTSISLAIAQLIPAGNTFNTNISDVYESHFLERNKYLNQTNLLVQRAFTKQNFSGPARGVQELLYNWSAGSAPTGSLDKEDINCLWQKDRRVKDIATRPSNTGTTREVLRNVKNNHSLASYGTMRTDTDGSSYLGSTYALRKLAKPYNFSAVQKQIIHGGVNFRTNKNKLLLMEALAPHGEELTAPQNIITIGVGAGSGLEIPQDCDDPIKSTRSTLSGRASTQKTFWNSQASLGKFAGDEYRAVLKGDSVLPFSFVEDTVHTGYNKEIKSYFESDVVVTNVHPDITYITNDIPMQGPFTETHVGGHQARHISINSYSTDKSLTVSSPVSAANAKGSIEFVPSIVTKGDYIDIYDSDQTYVRARRNSYYDLDSEYWTNAVELAAILANKLDMRVDIISDDPTTILALTQSAWGTDGNKTITVSTSNITASGFSGGANAGSYTTYNANLDSTANRPEAWAIVTKAHDAIADTDGAMGFVGPDYGGTYPNILKPWAIRFRDEHAKRPVNIRNIQYTTASQNIGNYRKGYELVIMDKADQRRWYRDAYDSDLDLPVVIKTTLPDTTNYMTLIGQESYTGGQTGNIFGQHPSNRAPDGQEIGLMTPSDGEFAVTGAYFAGRYASGSFVVTGTYHEEAAEGSVKVLGKDYHAVGDLLSLPDRTYGSDGAVLTYALDGIDAVADYQIAPGSSDTDFYNNLSSSVWTNNELTSTYTAYSAVYGQGLRIKLRNRSYMKVDVDSSEIAIGAWTLAFWTYMDSGTGGRRSIYKEISAVGSGVGREVYVDSAGRLRLYVNYRRNNEGSYTNAYDQYYIEGFNLHAGSPTHVVWTHSGSLNSTTDGHLYINGAKMSLITSAGGSGPTSTPQNTPSELWMFNDTALTSTTLSNGGESFIDEIVVLNTTASHHAVNLLFNKGARLNLNSTVAASCIIPSASIRQYYSFETDANVNHAGTVDCLGAAPLDLAITNILGCFALVSGSTGAVANVRPYALFNLAGLTGSSTYNGAVTVPTTGAYDSYYDSVNLSGGGDFGAEDGDLLSFASTYNFYLDDDGTSDSGTNYYIQNTGSSVEIWHALETKLEAVFPFAVTRSTTGTQYATFHITSSTIEDGFNFAMTETGTSYSSLSGMAGGQDSGGAQDGHTILFASSSGTLRFHFDDDAASDTSTSFYIQNTGSDAAMWHMLKTKIIANTGISEINIDTTSPQAIFRLTSSVIDQYTLSFSRDVINSIPLSFTSMVNVGGGTFPAYTKDIVIEIPRTDLTSSTFEINTRFSAPGGPEVQTDGYLDVASKSYSVHNALPYRNLTVRGSGSGEEGTIRMYDHIGRRRGLKSLLAIPMGRFGADHQFGVITAADYPTSGSFHKYHRNTWYRYEYSGDSIITGSRNDNAYIGSTLPRSDFQYGWIRNTISGSDWRRLQNINGYAPKDGLVSASLKSWKEDRGLPDAGNSYIGYPESPPAAWIQAINFPTGSTIYLGSTI